VARERLKQRKRDRLLTEWRQDRVIHGVHHSRKVAAEYARLTGLEPPPDPRYSPERIQESIKLPADVTAGWE
jgi:hypothetical protein